MKKIHFRVLFLLSLLMNSVSGMAQNDCEFGLSQWQFDAVYKIGNVVLHDGTQYEAKWWTKGDNPEQNSGQWEVWKKKEACDSTDVTELADTPELVDTPELKESSTPESSTDSKLPGQPNIAWMQSTFTEDEPIDVAWNMWWGHNGDQWHLLNNDAVVYTGQLVQNPKPSAQSGKHRLTLDPGSHELVVQLCDQNLCTRSDAKMITVIGNSSVGDSSVEEDGVLNQAPDANISGDSTVQIPTQLNEPTDDPSSTAVNPSDYRVIGYFTGWGVYARNYHVKDIVQSGSASNLTHIIYAFGNVIGGKCQIGDAYADFQKQYDKNSSVDGEADAWGEGLAGNFGQLRRLKAMYPHLKILWSFGGWTLSSGFGEAASNPKAFADSCYDLVYEDRSAGLFDGIDIDWEYPNACGLNCDTSGPDAYPTLMKALRDRFGDQLVTAAITASAENIEKADYAKAAQYVDFYMVMTYDYFGAWSASGPTALHSPLTGYADMPKPVSNNSKDSISLLMQKGIASEKLLLGIGFYGRGWAGVTQSAPGGSATGAASGTYEAGIDDYKVLKNRCPVTGTLAGTAYAHCEPEWWSYDTPDTIKTKMNYVKDTNLGGSFFWELSGDDDGELLQSIQKGLDK